MKNQVIIRSKVPGWPFRVKLGFRFTVHAMFDAAEYKGIDNIADIFKIPDDELIPLMYYFAHDWYCYKHRKRPKYSVKNAKKVFGIMSQDDAQRVFSAYLYSKIGGETMQDLFKKNSGSKKKLQLTKSEQMPSEK